jgi:hypothetical protein
MQHPKRFAIDRYPGFNRLQAFAGAQRVVIKAGQQLEAIIQTTQKTEIDFSAAGLSARRRKGDIDPAWRAPVAISYRCEFLSLDRFTHRSDSLSFRWNPFVVDFTHETESVLVKSEPDMQSMLDVSATAVASAGQFSTGAPAQLIDCDFVGVPQLGAREFKSRGEPRDTTATDHDPSSGHAKAPKFGLL